MSKKSDGNSIGHTKQSGLPRHEMYPNYNQFAGIIESYILPRAPPWWLVRAHLAYYMWPCLGLKRVKVELARISRMQHGSSTHAPKYSSSSLANGGLSFSDGVGQLPIPPLTGQLAKLQKNEHCKLLTPLVKLHPP